MKKFLILTFSFSAVFISIVAVAAYITFYNANNIDWTLPKNKHILFAGKSHVMCGFNDSLLQNAVNVSSDGQYAMFIYIKLKKLFAANSQIDTLLLEMGHNDLTPNLDSSAYGFSRKYLGYYWPYFEKENFKVYANKLLESESISAIKTAFRSLLKNPKKESYYGFQKCKESDSLTFANLRKNFLPAYDFSYCKENCSDSVGLYYLQKIVAMCNKKNIKLIFVHFPFYRKDEMFSSIEFEAKRKRLFPNIEYHDYSDIFNDSIGYFKDPFHLNYIGADKFTKILVKDFSLK